MLKSGSKSCWPNAAGKCCAISPPESFERWRSAHDLAPKTQNEYLIAASTFLKWMLRGSNNQNPLQSVERVETRGRERRKRRALSDEDMGKLLQAAGPARAIVYTVAALSGIRRKELASLRWSDFEDGVEGSKLNLRASTTKNKKAAPLPLHPVAEALLREIRPDGGGGEEEIFACIPSMHFLKKDLAAAGIAYKDEQGRQFDFHAFRHTFCTMLQRHGVPVAVAMVLMRHGDPRLTLQTYVDGSKLPVAKAMSELDWLGKGRTEIRTELGVFCGPSASHDVTTTETACGAETLINTMFAADLSQNVALFPEPGKLPR